MKQTIPLSLYIHIPWCVRKCPYCDFNSHQKTDALPEAEYVTCLLQDLQQDLQQYHIDRPLHSIFIGGGTPSLFSARTIGNILEAVDRQWGIANNIEITMEANPGTVEQKNFAAFRNTGINRLSLGIQSFADAQLKNLGRIHSGKEAIQAIDIARRAGFDNFNLDLMFGLPQQSMTEGLSDLQQAIDLQPVHISWYQLTLEPNTVFYKKPPKLPHEDLIADLYDAGQQLLAKHQFAQYEISAYAKNQEYSVHNLNYWHFGDYLGIGAGAHGKITLADRSVMRTRKIKQPESYLSKYSPLADQEKNHYTAEQHLIAPEQLPFEYFLNRLRLNAPMLISEIPDYIKLDWSAQNSPLYLAQEKEFLHIDSEKITKTALGQRFLNDLLMLFL